MYFKDFTYLSDGVFTTLFVETSETHAIKKKDDKWFLLNYTYKEYIDQLHTMYYDNLNDLYNTYLRKKKLKRITNEEI